MTEVTRHNFVDLFSKIEYAINNADFISIDTEFTGLCYDTYCKPSLFDSSSDRYTKLRQSVQKFTLVQIGLTTFSGNVNTNSYQEHTFVFYLFPMAFGSYDQRISLQTSSIQFLCKHKFDFNKWLFDGIPYMNLSQEKQVKEDLESGHLVAGLERDIDEKAVQSICSYVASWIPNSKCGDCLTLPVSEDISSSNYVIHMDLRTRFSQIWTSTNVFEQIVVERVHPEKRCLLEEESKESEKEHQKQLLLEMLGLTRVFRLLQQAQKPLIGHNMLMDLLFLYEKFHKPLPESYAAFKQEIHKIFPSVFDTKHINHTIRKSLESFGLHGAGNLQELYDIWNSKPVMNSSLLQPTIEHCEGNVEETKQAHHAGYDAYLCGSIFLRVCHYLHFRTLSSMEAAVCPFKSYLFTMSKFCNCVNVIRATVNFTKLDDKEPPSFRPPLLYVETRGKKLVSEQLAVWLSLYGTVDIHMISSRQAVVATSNFGTARDIFNAYKDSSLLKVTKYRFWQHSRVAQGVWWGSFALATGAGFLLMANILR